MGVDPVEKHMQALHVRYQSAALKTHTRYQNHGNKVPTDECILIFRKKK